MKILFVCHRLPYPPNRGGKIRSFNMIAHLAQRHSVVVASLAHSNDELEEGKPLSNHCEEVIVERLSDRTRWIQAFKALPTAHPSSVAYFRSDRLDQRIREAVQRYNFDAVIVHCAFVAQYVRKTDGKLRILDYGDMDSAKWSEYSQHRRFPLSMGYAIESKKLRDYERDVAPTFHHTTVTTEAEREEFLSLGTPVPCSVIPNGVDTSYFKLDPVPGPRPPVIAFLGRMDYFPNIDGVCYFAEKVFPIVRKKIPAARFIIIGSDPSRQVRELARLPGILVTGHVADVRNYLKDAAVSVAPLRIARGTQNKILESMAMGIPVVTSPQAAKGVQAVPGKHLLVADHPAEFASAVVDVLTRHDLWSGLVTSAKAHLNEAHTWPTSMIVLDQLLADFPAAPDRQLDVTPDADGVAISQL